MLWGDGTMVRVQPQSGPNLPATGLQSLDWLALGAMLTLRLGFLPRILLKPPVDCSLPEVS